MIQVHKFIIRPKQIALVRQVLQKLLQILVTYQAMGKV